MRLLRFPLLLLFICSCLAAEAQGPSVPPAAKPEPAPMKQANPVPAPAPAQKSENDASIVFLFRIRSAFMLTPAMIHSLQTKSGEGGASQGSASAPKVPAPSAESGKDIAWGDSLERMVPFAAPLDVRLMGKNVLALIQILPIALHAAIVDLIVQGQVWVKMPDDSLSLKTTVQTLSLPLGSRLYFYPLGVDAKTGAPIAVEIRVDRQAKQ